jgi:hypothetical protein
LIVPHGSLFFERICSLRIANPQIFFEFFLLGKINIKINWQTKGVQVVASYWHGGKNPLLTKAPDI